MLNHAGNVSDRMELHHVDSSRALMFYHGAMHKYVGTFGRIQFPFTYFVMILACSMQYNSKRSSHVRVRAVDVHARV
eukprot:7336606-Pyramimonas_sp.AAC.1